MVFKLRLREVERFWIKSIRIFNWWNINFTKKIIENPPSIVWGKKDLIIIHQNYFRKKNTGFSIFDCARRIKKIHWLWSMDFINFSFDSPRTMINNCFISITFLFMIGLQSRIKCGFTIFFLFRPPLFTQNCNYKWWILIITYIYIGNVNKNLVKKNEN